MATGHVFISHIRDDSDKVKRLERALVAVGLEVWRDTAELWPGDSWRMKIRQAIADDALVVIACFSHKSLARSVSYQNEELALAIDQMRLRQPGARWLIPVRFDNCQVPDLEIGGGTTLRSLQWADLFGSSYARDTARLVRVVQQQILGPELRTTSRPPVADRRSRGRTSTLNTSPWGSVWTNTRDMLRGHREIVRRSVQILIAGLAATSGSLAFIYPDY